MLIAYISDVHANLEAFSAVLNKIDSLGIERIYCLGDVIGYAASPNQCIELLLQNGIPTILGNHEWAVMHEDTAWFNPIASEAIYWTIDNLDKKHFDWLKSLQERVELKIEGHKALLVHGSPTDSIWKYVFEENVDENFVKNLDYDIVVVGHTHMPFVKRVKGKLVINCGAIGQPRDHNPKASFAVFDAEKFDAEIVRVEYDVRAAAEKIIKTGLPPFLAHRLTLGI